MKVMTVQQVHRIILPTMQAVTTIIQMQTTAMQHQAITMVVMQAVITQLPIIIIIIQTSIRISAIRMMKLSIT